MRRQPEGDRCGDDASPRAMAAGDDVAGDPPTGSSSGLSEADDHFGFAAFPPGVAPAGTLAPGDRCGGCTILRLLAEGGMGRVYEARQDAPARTVAVKVMREGMVAPEMRLRFSREADLLGRLQHPAIAQVYAAGIEPAGPVDRPFIVMELVSAASPITQFARGRRLGPRDRVALFAAACRGVAHAHGQGIIHRDLKPANILVDEAGRPKLIDFGVGRPLATETERLTTATRQGELLGTLRYMSPEQLGVGEGGIDARSDVYALGLVLHELLTGRLPHELRGRSVVEAACILGMSRGVAARPLARELAAAGLTAFEARSLACLMAVCLEPRAADRYPDAGSLAADLDRWVAGEPVRARPPTLAESVARLARRHRMAALAAVLVVVSLAAAVVGVSAFWLRSERQREAAERAEAAADEGRREAIAKAAEARRQLYLSTVLLAAEARDRDNLTEARRLMAEGTALAAERGRRPIELSCLEASLDESLAVVPGGDTVASVAWSPDGRTAAAGTMDGRLRIWRPDEPDDTAGGVDREAHRAAIWDVAFSPDGRLLASASADGTICLHDVAGGELVRSLAGHEAAVYAADFSPDGSLLATSSRDRTIRLWDTATWRERSLLRGHEGTVFSTRFSPSGDRLVSASQDGTLRLWSIADAAETGVIQVGGGRVFRAAFSPDGRRVAAAAEDGSATVWEAAGGRELARLRHPTRVNAVAFLSQGRLLATASGDGLLRSWTVADGTEIGRRGHAGALWSLAVRPLDAAALTGSADGTIRTWRLDGSADPVLPLADRGQALAIAADGCTLAVGDSGGRVTLVDPAVLRPLADFETGAGRVNDAAFSPAAAVLAAACDDGHVHRFGLADGQVLPAFASHSRRVYCVGFSADGRLLATGSEDRTARVVDAATGGESLPPLRHPARVFGIAFHPDGTRLATACGDRGVRIWSLTTGRELGVWKGHTGPVNWVSFAPEGDRLVSASSDGTVRIWNVSDGSPAAVLTGPARQVWRAAFSPAGDRVAATVADGTVQVWDVESGRTVAVLRGHRDQAWGLAFLPSGRGLATASWDATVRLWGVSVAELARARSAAAAGGRGVRP